LAFSNFYEMNLYIYMPIISNPIFISPRTSRVKKSLFISYINENQYQSLLLKKSFTKIEPIIEMKNATKRFDTLVLPYYDLVISESISDKATKKEEKFSKNYFLHLI